MCFALKIQSYINIIIQAYGRVYGKSIYRLHHGGLIVIVEIVEWREFLHSVVYVNTENKKLKEHIP